MKKRLFAVLASLCMVVSMVPTMAFAQDSGAAIGAGGLCEHHTEHTADCGYTEEQRKCHAAMNTRRIAIPLQRSVFTPIRRSVTLRTAPLPRLTQREKNRSAVMYAARKAAA